MISARSVAAETDVLICAPATAESDRLCDLLVKDVQDLGYVVEQRGDCDARSDQTATSLIRIHNVQALVSLEPDSRSAAIWVRDKEGNTVKRTLDFSHIDSDNSSQAALNISELLRATFVELETTPWRQRQEAIPSSVEVELERGALSAVVQAKPDEVEPAGFLGDRRERPRPKKSASQPLGEEKGSADPMVRIAGSVSRRLPLRFSFGGGVTAMTFKYPPTAHLFIGGHLLLNRMVEPTLLVLGPLIPLTIRQEEGTVAVRKAVVAAGIRLSPFKRAGRFGVALGGGVGLDTTFVKGDAEEEMKGYFRTTFAAFPYGQLALQVSLVKRIVLIGNVLVGSSIPRTRITVAEREVVTVSALFLCGVIGVSLKI